LNLDKAQYNNLLEVLVQDKDFMKEFLMRAQTSLLGQKKKRNDRNNRKERVEEITTMQYDDTPGVEILEERDGGGLNQEEYNVNDIMLNGGQETQETPEIYYEEEKDQNKEMGDEMEKDKILEEDICYNRLLKLVNQYRFNKVFNILIEVLNKSDFVTNNLDEEFIKEEIIDITKIIRKDVLFVYLMKIMSNNFINNIYKAQPRMPPAPKQYRETYIEPPKPKPKPMYDKKEIVVRDNFQQQFGNLGAFDNPKKKQKFNEPSFQYRWKHFEMKNGVIYCFFPKTKTNSSKFSLYCIKRGTCNAKLRVDLALKKVNLIGSHNNHEGVNVDKLKVEFPELMRRDWSHLQYDCYEGNNILIWKF